MEPERALRLIRTNGLVRDTYNNEVVPSIGVPRYRLINWVNALRIQSLSETEAAEVFAKVGLAIMAKEQEGHICPRCRRILTRLDFASGSTDDMGKCYRCHYEFAVVNGKAVSHEV